MLRPLTAHVPFLPAGLSPIREIQPPAIGPKSFIFIGSSSASRHGFLNGPAQGTTFLQAPDNGAFNWLNGLLEYPYTAVGNFGVAGTLSADCLNSQLPTVLAMQPSVVGVITGSNDVQQTGNATVPIATTIANITKIYDTLLAAGIVVFAFSLHHLRQGGAAQTHKVMQVNAAIRSYCDTHAGIIFIDTVTDTVDAADTTNGYSKTGYVTTDNIHLTQKACRQIAERAFADPVIKALLQKNRNIVYSPIETRTNDGGNRNLFDNPFLPGIVGAGNTSTALAIAATGGTPTFTPALVARADGRGNDQQVAITSNAAGDTVQISGTLINNAFVNAGDILQGLAVIGMTGATAVKSLNLQIVFTVGGTIYRTIAFASSAVNAAEYDQRDLTNFTMQTPQFIVPPGAVTTGRWRVEVVFDGASTGTVISVGTPQIMKLN